MASDEEWYWDLSRNEAVPASRREHPNQLMGPYRTKAEAENWRASVKSRNESWDEQDEAWNGDPDDADGG